MATQLRTPALPSTGASGALSTRCVILGIDPGTNIAHVQTSLGKPLQVSLTRLPGKGSLPPVAGETWMITQMFGNGWTFMFCINPPARSGPTSDRPTNPTTSQFYFDTTLDKPIWFGNTAWQDASGNPV